MIQNFEVTGGPHIGRANLPLLRARLAELQLDGLIVPHEDEYQNEYLPANADRLGWVSGFTGSAGAAIIMSDRAVMFSDGRYTLQVRAQVDSNLYEFADLLDPGVAGWIAAQAKNGERIGYDPRLVSPDNLARWQKAAELSGASLLALTSNPVDEVWGGRPEAPSALIHPHPIEFAGVSHGSKIAAIASELQEQGVDTTLITAPSSIAWLFNIRGGDVACSPLPLSTAMVHKDGTACLFVNEAKLTDETRIHLGNSITIKPESAIEANISSLKGSALRIDPASASAWYFEAAASSGVQIVRAQDPCLIPKACKNEVEIEGARIAHRRDGLALVRFLHWLSSDSVQNGAVDEITAASKLESFRTAAPELKDISFESISGAGPNGAIVHYRVNTNTNLALEPGSLFLIDSGGQYLEGTTDVTRTVAIGKPDDEMRDRFTRVLKGHIALSRVRFPAGTTGTHLDALARMYLWEAGLDYDHGTGHGVGSYLGVHEGPQGITRGWNSTELRAGMIVSNEPGFYKQGAFGIRIENLQVVTAAAQIEGGERPMLGFESLTLAPIDLCLIKPELLSPAETKWLDNYHKQVRETHMPHLSGEPANWLQQATRKLSEI